jgi:hypothetical protein
MPEDPLILRDNEILRGRAEELNANPAGDHRRKEILKGVKLHKPLTSDEAYAIREAIKFALFFKFDESLAAKASRAVDRMMNE